MLGLGHLNDSYNFSVSICPALMSPPPPNWATAKEPSRLTSPSPHDQFHIVISSRAEEGQYSLNFHNCHNSIPGQEQPFDLTVSVGISVAHS